MSFLFNMVLDSQTQPRNVASPRRLTAPALASAASAAATPSLGRMGGVPVPFERVQRVATGGAAVRSSEFGLGSGEA